MGKGQIYCYVFFQWFFLNLTVRCLHLSFFSISFSFTLWSAGVAKSTRWQVLSFLLINTRSGLLARIRWSVCISKSQRILWVSFSRMDSGLCVYHLVAGWKFNFLHSYQWITFPTQSCLVLYSLCASLLHSLTIWLTVSSLSLHLLFCWVLSIFALI